MTHCWKGCRRALQVTGILDFSILYVDQKQLSGWGLGAAQKQTQWTRKYTHMLLTEQPGKLSQCICVVSK